MSTTSVACRECGRLDFPHVCKTLVWPELLQIMVVADEQQGRVSVKWNFIPAAAPVAANGEET